MTAAAPHPHYLSHARKILADAEGDARNADKLAAWAQLAAGQDRPPHGALVAADGSIVAETVYHRGMPGAVYVNHKAISKYRLDRHALEGALPAIATQVRQRVIHVPLSKFSGAAPDRV